MPLFQAPHLPNEAPQATIDKYADLLNNHPSPARHIHAAMVDELDQAIGIVLSIYKEQGMLDNTLVLFMSDNGGLILPGSEETHTLFKRSVSPRMNGSTARFPYLAWSLLLRMPLTVVAIILRYSVVREWLQRAVSAFLQQFGGQVT